MLLLHGLPSLPGFVFDFSAYSSHPRSTEGDRMTTLLRQTQEPLQGCDAFWCKSCIGQLVIQLSSQSENRKGMQLCSDLHQYCIFTFNELSVSSSAMTNKPNPAVLLYRKFSVSKCIYSSCFWPLLVHRGKDPNRCSLADGSAY